MVGQLSQRNIQIVTEGHQRTLLALLQALPASPIQQELQHDGGSDNVAFDHLLDDTRVGQGAEEETFCQQGRTHRQFIAHIREEDSKDKRVTPRKRIQISLAEEPSTCVVKLSE